ncbi:MAG TPA: hypothetical protein VN033_09410 [Vulgatibacter sp.]|nr:hypothetical protein [Vulgatibacter sp.]
MCWAVKCPSCGRPDWRGCGAHVEQVLGHVPKEERCCCRETGERRQADLPGLSSLWKWIRGR